jgi:hypothetical protein
MNDPIEKYIKTECGITEYHRLKALSKKTFYINFVFIGLLELEL